MIGTPEERFWDKVIKGMGCWPWLACLNEAGYGIFWNGSRLVRAHRYSYELVNGTIPKGLDLDHLCRNEYCVNPDHLEPVSHRINCLRGTSPSADNARKTECPKGHPYSGDNLIEEAGGSRRCRACKSERQKAYWARRGSELRRQRRIALNARGIKRRYY